MLNPQNTGSGTSTTLDLGSFGGKEVLEGWTAQVPLGLTAWFQALCFDAGKLELPLTNCPPPHPHLLPSTFKPLALQSWHRFSDLQLPRCYNLNKT